MRVRYSLAALHRIRVRDVAVFRRALTVAETAHADATKTHLRARMDAEHPRATTDVFSAAIAVDAVRDHRISRRRARQRRLTEARRRSARAQLDRANAEIKRARIQLFGAIAAMRATKTRLAERRRVRAHRRATIDHEDTQDAWQTRQLDPMNGCRASETTGE